MVRSIFSTKRNHPQRPVHDRVTMLYPWEIPEMQELNEAIAELSATRDTLEPEEDDDEPGWGALMQATLRDERHYQAA